MRLRIQHTSVSIHFQSKSVSYQQFCISFIIFTLFAFDFLAGHSQVSITNFGTPYTTNFNTIGNTQTATLPAGFVSGGSWGAGVTQTNQIGGSAGTVSVLTGTSIAGFYNFGTGQSDTATDRSIGFIYTTAYRNPHSIIYAFTNNTGSDIRQISLTWDYKKYRTGQLAHYWNFYHGSNTNTVNTTVSSATASSIVVPSTATGILPGMSITITSGTGALSPNTVVQSATAGIPSASFITISLSQPVATAITAGAGVSFNLTATTLADSTAYAADANSTTINAIPTVVSKTVNLNSVTIPNGTTYYLRWMMGANTGASPAIGLDNLSITFGDGRCYPYVQARLDSVTVGASNSLNVNYTRGNGNNILIVASTSATPTAPTNNTSYTANTSFGSGTAIGSGFVVYNGAGNGINAAHTVNVTNLSSSTQYYFYLYEYNNSGICYHPTTVSGTGYFTGSTDYFRSRASGNWNTPATWESSKDNISWLTAAAKPDSLSRGIIIRSPDSVAIAAQETAKNLTVSSGATLSYNTTVAAAGSAFTIGNDPANEFDFNIYGKYIIFGNPATLAVGARVKIFNGGLIRADNNSGGLSDNFAFNQNVFFANGSVFEWNNTNSLNSSNSVYFNYLGAQPISDVPTFRFTKAPSTPIGASTATRINGITEINAATGQLQFQSTGLKYFRNGITGTGTLLQAATSGQFVVSGPAVLGGTGPINLSNTGLRIADTSVTTLLSDKPINGVSPSLVTLDGTLYTSTYAITGSAPFATSATAKLYIGSPNGITASSASGNIQSTGSRTFSGAAAYHYYGTANQVTGDGLPTTITGSLNISNTGAASNNIVTLTTTGTTTSTLNLNAGLFACGSTGILNISSAGIINGNNGNIYNDPTAGTINFLGTGTVQGSASSLNFYNVSTSGGVNFGSAITSTINNLFRINTGGFVNTNAPVYNTGATLQYNTGTVYGRGLEFSTTTGKGYPFHVQVSNNSSLDLGNGGTSTARQMAGNLTIDAGSSFLLDNGVNDMTAALTVLGDVNNNGTLNLSDASGGDIIVGGNWTRGSAAVFNHKGRTVTFNNTTANQIITVTGGGTETFGYLTINKSSTSSLLLQSAPTTDIVINGGAGGNVLRLINGNMDLNGRTCTFNMYSGAVNNIGIDGSAGNLNRRIISTIAGGVFACYNSDASPRISAINRLSAQSAILIVNPGVVMTIGGLSQNSGINFGSGTSYINGNLQINTWGYVETNAPLYGVNSNLIYNVGGSYKRYLEWSTTTGFGYPFNVTIQNNTQLRINDDGPGQNGTADRAIAGTLTIQSGSSATLGDSTENNKLTIGKDFVLNGTMNMPSTTVAIGADLYIAGNWNRSATGIFNHNERAVFFNGSTNSIITASGGQYFPYLYLQKTASSNTLSLADNISVGKIFTINSGKFDLAAKDATLLSNATATAQFGPVGVNGDVLYSGTGRFVVERYLPTGTGAGQHGKSWQFLAVPTNSGQTIKQAWQEGSLTANSNPAPGYGTQIAGNVGGSNAGAIALGFDVYTPAGPGMKTYNTNGTWTGIPNTSNALYDPKGYMIFVRGDRSVTAYNQASTSTILRSRGKLFVPVSNPSPASTIPAGGFQSIGNPYASAIEFTSIITPGYPDVDPVFYVWDPLLVGSNGVGGYQMISANNGDFYPIPGGTLNYPSNVRCTKIQSGQAFMMHATGAGGSVSFDESVKVAGSSNTFRPPYSFNDNKQYLRIYLYNGQATTDRMVDATILSFSENFSNDYDPNDALKLTNNGENISIISGNRKLALETRMKPVLGDSIQLSVSGLTIRSYQLRIAPVRMNETGLTPMLVDRLDGSRHPINTIDTTYYNFEVNANPSTYAANRFYLIFGKVRNIPKSPTLAETAKTQQASASNISSIKASVQVFPNPVTDGHIQLFARNLAMGNASVYIYNQSGQLLFKKQINIVSSNEKIQLTISDLPKNIYRIELRDQKGNNFAEQLIVE